MYLLPFFSCFYFVFVDCPPPFVFLHSSLLIWWLSLVLCLNSFCFLCVLSIKDFLTLCKNNNKQLLTSFSVHPFFSWVFWSRSLLWTLPWVDWLSLLHLVLYGGLGVILFLHLEYAPLSLHLPNLLFFISMCLVIIVSGFLTLEKSPFVWDILCISTARSPQSLELYKGCLSPSLVVSWLLWVVW